MTTPRQMVYETEGQHGGDVRGWHGEEARAEAYAREMEEHNRHLSEEGWAMTSHDDLTGYRDAFFQIGDMLGLPAMACSPKEAFEKHIIPTIQELLKDKARLDSGRIRHKHPKDEWGNEGTLHTGCNLRDDIDEAMIGQGVTASEEMVTLLPGLPALPKWLLDAATKIDQYMAKHHPGHWEILGVRGGYPRYDGPDSKRLDWLESQVESWGDGQTEPCEAEWGFIWKQEGRGDTWLGLRSWIDKEMRRVYSDDFLRDIV